MKSTHEQLEKRGFLADDFNSDLYDLSLNEKLKLLESSIPTERTLAARLLKNGHSVDSLIKALIKEKQLYTKIELSTTLVSYAETSVKPLISLLGTIGTNQHKCVPDEEFKKDNYPLPRDLASRILAHIGKIALPELLNSLEKLDSKQLSEAIDALGFICFYNPYPNAFQILKKLFLQNSENELIKWKIIRACSGFPESEDFLEMEKGNQSNQRLKKEIDRSMYLIKKRA